MADSKIDTVKSTLVASGQVLVPVVVTAAGGGLAATAMASGAFEAAAGVGSTLFKAVIGRRLQGRSDQWLKSVAYEWGIGDCQEAEARLLSEIDNPDPQRAEAARAAVFSIARKILDDIDEAIIPYLGRVTALQVSAGRIDRRDRHVVDLVASIDGPTLEAVQNLLRGFLQEIQDQDEKIEVGLAEPHANLSDAEVLDDWQTYITRIPGSIGNREARRGMHRATDRERRAIDLLASSHFLTPGISRLACHHFVCSSSDLNYLWARLRPASE